MHVRPTVRAAGPVRTVVNQCMRNQGVQDTLKCEKGQCKVWSRGGSFWRPSKYPAYPKIARNDVEEFHSPPWAREERCPDGICLYKKN